LAKSNNEINKTETVFFEENNIYEL